MNESARYRGTGPTGPLVIDGLLKRGFEVTIFHSGNHEVDLPKSVEHLHGSAHFKESIENVIGSRSFELVVAMYGRLRHVAEALKGKTQRLIAIGGAPYSAFVHGNRQPGGVRIDLSENAPVCLDEKENKFSYLMALSENTVMDAHKKGFYNATILRFPMIYGPRQVAPREWCVIRRILDGRKQMIIPDGGLKLERRGYSENMAHAILLTVDKPEQSSGEIFNAGDEAVLSVREWLSIITGAMDCQVELISMPFSLARPSRPYAGRDFHWVSSIRKITEKLEYRDLFSVEDGMESTVRWYLENRPEPGGVLEEKLSDPFDYEREDIFIRRFKEMEASIRKTSWTGFQFDHAYAHPKK